jgi:acylphosphatase
MSGDQEKVDKMLEWLAHGPHQAEVANIEKKQVKYNPHDFFSIS